MSQKKQYQTIGLGGTFDHFHAGHRHFLSFANELAEELRVGITTAELHQNKSFSDQIESYDVRAKSVEEFLQSIGAKYELFPLTSPFGPTLEDSPIEALAVTQLTESGGKKINIEREKKGLRALPIHVSMMLRDESGEYLSSTRIRQGVVNREGKTYQAIFENDKKLSDTQRKFFSMKQGKVVSIFSDEFSRKYVVGDVVLEHFLQQKWPVSVGIYDQRSNRQEYVSDILQKLHPSADIENPPGSISKELVKYLMKISQDSAATTFLQVHGEEDLAAVALLLLMPLGSAIYYGQQGEGMVEMIITEELKEKFAQILLQDMR